MGLFDEPGTPPPHRWSRSLGGGLGLASYAISYWDAAQKLSDAHLKHTPNYVNEPRPIGVYPMVFLYRHAFELMLKSIVLDHNHLFARDPKVVLARSHRLHDYPADLRAIDNSLPTNSGGTQIVTEEEWALLDAVIKGWAETDPDSMHFRYSVNRQCDTNATAHTNFSFDFKTFVDQMNESLEVIEKLYRESDSLKQWEAEELAGIHEWIREIEGASKD